MAMTTEEMLSNLEELLTLAQVTAILPGRPARSTLARWFLRGVRGVKLETVVIGGRRFVSRSALERFIGETTASRSMTPTAPVSVKSRTKAIERAERAVAKAGI